MTFDVKRFLKLCAMSASDKDGEALNAIRMANRMLKEAKLSWEEAWNLGCAPTIRIVRPMHEKKTSKVLWRGYPNQFSTMFPEEARWLLANRLRNSFARSVSDQIVVKGFITNRQMEVIRDRLYGQAA